MDAEKTLHLWRRILREETLCRTLLEGKATPKSLGFFPEESGTVLAFRESSREAYWPIQGYRFRLIDEISSSVAIWAPLTTTVLSSYGYSTRSLVESFLERVGWRDYGWFAVGASSDFLSFVVEVFADKVVALKDLIALETAQLSLLARLTDTQIDSLSKPFLLDETLRYQRAPYAEVISIGHDLSLWLEEPEQAAQVVPVEGEQHLIVYLESLEEMPQYAGLSAEAALLFEALQEPKTVEEAAAELGFDLVITKEAMEALGDIGGIRGVR